MLPGNDINNFLKAYKNKAEEELSAILLWWQQFMPDEQKGGFYGSVNNQNKADADAAKGIVLNSRILWSFSAAYLFEQEEKYKMIAKRAYQYIIKHFIDEKYGGVFWSVDASGKMLDGRKQIYGLAFTIYALAEFYKATKNEEALSIAKVLFNVIEKYSFDKEKTGYVEAFTRDWSHSGNLRLSDKDDNEKKTMNTHLHIIEAYANLYMVWRDADLKNKILLLLDNFDQHIINQQNDHLNLFLDENWNLKSSLISFGHDIEAAWLLQECAEIIGEASYIENYKSYAIKIANAALEGWDERNGGLWYEYDPATNHWIKEKHWWPQAEAMVGFFNAYQISNNIKYLDLSKASFDCILAYLKDQTNGEWFWGIRENDSLIEKEKAGFWKCPYHNSRACLEIIKRTNKIISNAN